MTNPSHEGTPSSAQHQDPGQELPHFPLVIGGQWVEAVSGRNYETIDPFRGEAWATAPDADDRDVGLAVAAGSLTGFGRVKLLRRLGDIITRDADYLAELETRDTGKLAREMRGQLAGIAEWFFYYAGLADKLEGTTIPSDKSNFLIYTRREPVAVVAAIVPWLPSAAADLEAGAGTCGRLHDRREAQ